MIKDFIYFGFVCLNYDNKPIMVSKILDSFIVTGVISETLEFSIENEYNINEYEGIIVGIKFFDGTESVTIEYSHSVKYVDIIYAIETYGKIQNAENSPIHEMIYKKNKRLNDLWLLLEEFFETEEGSKKLKHFQNKDCWIKN